MNILHKIQKFQQVLNFHNRSIIGFNFMKLLINSKFPLKIPLTIFSIILKLIFSIIKGDFLVEKVKISLSLKIYQ